MCRGFTIAGQRGEDFNLKSFGIMRVCQLSPTEAFVYTGVPFSQPITPTNCGSEGGVFPKKIGNWDNRSADASRLHSCAIGTRDGDKKIFL